MGAPIARRTLACLAMATLAIVSACTSDDDPTAAPTIVATTSTTVDPFTSTTRAPLDPDDIDGGEQAYIDALVASFDEGENANPLFSEAQAECLAPRWVEAIGLEAFAAGGLSPDDLRTLEVGLEALDLDEQTADAMIEAIPACDIDLRGALLAGFGLDQLPPTVGECVDAALTQELALRAYRNQLLDISSDEESLAPVFECFEAYERQLEAEAQQPGG